MPEKVIIIGSGPAGWTAAIYAARANLEPLVYEGAISAENQVRGTLPLGQLNLTTEVENYPGFPKGIGGPELMLAMREQAERYGTRIVTKDIVSADLSRRPFNVKDNTGDVLESHALIIATGASANYLGLASEDKFKNRGVSACAVCDGALPRFRNKPLIVVGGGDTAAEEGSYLAKYASNVHLIHRRDKLRASPIMADRLLSNPKVQPHWNHVVAEVIGDEERGMTAVRLSHVLSGAEKTIDAVGMFVAIGHTPNTALFTGQLDMDENGYLIATHGSLSKIPGVFVAGDVQDHRYRQAVTAAGSGCMAALDAEKFLEEHNHQ